LYAIKIIFSLSRFLDFFVSCSGLFRFPAVRNVAGAAITLAAFSANPRIFSSDFSRLLFDTVICCSYSAAYLILSEHRFLFALMDTKIDISLLPPCCNSGCTTCVLDYPELYVGTIDANYLAMLEAMEQAALNTAPIEESTWTSNEKQN
jgi:hypothetical protein